MYRRTFDWRAWFRIPRPRVNLVPHDSAYSTALEEVVARAAKITPAEYIVSHRRPSSEDNVVGIADDYLKQLHTLRMRIAREIVSATEEAERLQERMIGGIRVGTPITIVKAIQNNPTIRDDIKQLEKLIAWICPRDALGRLTKDLLFLEARRRFRDLAGKEAISLDCHWQFSWCDEIIPEGFPSGLLEALPPSYRRHGLRLRAHQGPMRM